MPFRRLFLSRWSALAWAAGIVWTAYDVADEAAPAQDPTAAAVASNQDDAAAEINMAAAILNTGY